MRNSTRGFTLIELVVTVALIAIMTAIAVPNFSAFQRNSQLTSVANSFIGAMSTARAEAMKRNHDGYVVPAVNGVPTLGTDWSVGWMVFVDVNSNGAYDAGTDVKVMVQEALPAAITTPSSTAVTQFISGGAAYVMFNGSGFPRRSGGAFAAPQALDFAIGSSTASTSMRRVIIGTTGRMWVCKPLDPGCNQS